MPADAPPRLVEAARDRLAAEWSEILDSQDTLESISSIPPAVVAAIRQSINSKTRTYRYVLPTQLLSKLVAPALDCRAVQKGAPLTVAFDARTVCHGPVVEFDRANESVLGGSTEPYANNPLRILSITGEYRQAQRDKPGFDELRLVLDFGQENPEAVPVLFRAVLVAVRDRLQTVRVVYPVPNRISLKQTVTTLDGFLQERTGGVRMQAVAAALFRCIGERFGLFTEVRSANINAADASTGSAADLECVAETGASVMAVEVKDRRLSLRHAQDKLPSVRERGIRELLFLVQGGVESADRRPVDNVIDRQFVTGQNIYVAEFGTFLESCLVLFGETGRRAFLLRVGEQLDSQRADLMHRKRWADLLQGL
jgi:hypothetical protein